MKTIKNDEKNAKESEMWWIFLMMMKQKAIWLNIKNNKIMKMR